MLDAGDWSGTGQAAAGRGLINTADAEADAGAPHIVSLVDVDSVAAEAVGAESEFRLRDCSGDECFDDGAGAVSEECTEILVCGASCQTEAYVENCMSPTSQGGQDHYMGLMRCVANSCGLFGSDLMKLQACMYEKCGD